MITLEGVFSTFSQATGPSRIYTEGMFIEHLKFLRHRIRKDKLEKVLNII